MHFPQFPLFRVESFNSIFTFYSLEYSTYVITTVQQAEYDAILKSICG